MANENQIQHQQSNEPKMPNQTNQEITWWGQEDALWLEG